MFNPRSFDNWSGARKRPSHTRRMVWEVSSEFRRFCSRIVAVMAKRLDHTCPSSPTNLAGILWGELPSLWGELPVLWGELPSAWGELGRANVLEMRKSNPILSACP